MSIVLGANQYGKEEIRVVRVYRDTDRHEIRDLNVSTSLRGGFVAAHRDGNQSDVLPTDSQKNRAFAWAKEHGVSSIEDYALTLCRGLLEAAPAATAARVEVEEYPWDRIVVGSRGYDHAFVRRGGDVRTTVVTIEGRGPDERASVVAGLKDLTVLKSTGSQFTGFLVDRYTTLPETDDRVLATSLLARWRYTGTAVDWNAAYDDVRRRLLESFATTYSRALQESLYAMGRSVLEAHHDVAEITFSAPNKHHLLVDLAPFGLENHGEVFVAADRPYGLIEATVTRDGDPSGAEVAGFNALSPAQARARVGTCLAVPRWVDEVVAARPYRDRPALLARADAAAQRLTDAELDAALSQHPRIGERATTGPEAFSAREQSGVGSADLGLARRLREGNLAYEKRFGRVFLVRAAGRDGPQILAELHRRLSNDDDAERAETVSNLREIALLRLDEVI